MPQIGELFDRLDEAELILAALVVGDEIPIRAEDGEQLVLVIDLSSFERLYGVPSLDQRSYSRQMTAV